MDQVDDHIRFLARAAVTPGYCGYHSEGLMHALKHRGLGKLIDPAKAGEFAIRWLSGISAFHEFDPFVIASLEIRAQCTKVGIPEVGGCPLCAADHFLPGRDIDEAWVTNVSDMMVQQAKLRQLIRGGL